MSQQSSPTQQPCSANAESFVDLLADVSQHGSSLFELLAMSPPSATAPAAPSNFWHPPDSSTHHHPFNTHQFTATNNTTASSDTLPGLPPSVTPSAHQTPHTSSVPGASTPSTPRRRSVRQTPSTGPNSNLRSSIAKPLQPCKRPSLTSKPSRSSVPQPLSLADSEDASDGSDEQPPHFSSNALPPTTPSTKKPPTIADKHLTQPNSNAESSVHSDPPVKQAHNSHTRRCRAKVNSKFQELMQILPPPSHGIKHKAQILEYTIQIFRDYHAKKMSLEAELALSSRAHLNAWVEGVVSHSVSLQQLLLPYLSLICTKSGWKYSEAWVSAQESDDICNDNGTTGMSGQSRLLTPANSAIGPNSKLRLGPTLIPPLGNTDDPDLQSKLERFRDKSRPYGCKARVDLPGRILCTMRPEWLPSLEDSEVFQRARLATDASLTMCFGVPVFIRGYVAAVAMFFDTEKRPYDAKCVDLADYVASLLGSSFGQTSMRQAQCR